MWLRFRAVVWRFLMRIGMFLHTVGLSRPPRHSFLRRIEFGSYKRSVDLYFYCPPAYFDYQLRKEGRPLPVVVNFHGGGFTLGSATDDSYWAKCVMQETGAVVVSVDYRRAPEHPFPAAVDDGVDALLYLAAHAGELGIDATRLAVTGFSAGGNMAITVPLRLQHRLQNDEGGEILKPLDSTQNLVSDSAANLRVVAIFAWYPLLDFVASRDHRRAQSVIPGKTMPAYLTNLFDKAYVPHQADRESPFASPERATDPMLNEGLPQDIFLYTCEWDMLLHEGQRFVRRLQGMGKNVRTMMIEKAPHAWDKSPNPFRNQEKVNIIYATACAELKRVLED